MTEMTTSRGSGAIFDAFVSPEIDPLFWTPPLIGKASAWWAHVPFAFWLMGVCKPRVFVELGTHNGVSYAAFCEAVARGHIATRCYAVDTWAGDAHAGQYGEKIYRDLRDFHDKHYHAFSELLRCTFEEAAGHIADGSVDLLHIDGFHTYEAVSGDFATWLPKLSDRAVVLFHDSNVRRDDFGVHRFFDELRGRYPCFEFLHGFGLGIAAVGSAAPEEILTLCSRLTDAEVGAFRQRFAYLGDRWWTTTDDRLQIATAWEHVGLAQQGRERAEGELARAEGELRVAATRKDEELSRARALAGEQNVRLEATAQDLTLRLQTAERQTAKAQAARAAATQLRNSSATRVAELRATIEHFATQRDVESERARARIAVLDERNERLMTRYTEAYQDPALGMKARLKTRLKHLRSRLLGRVDPSAPLLSVIRQSIYFDASWYRQTYADVAQSGVDPAFHYLRFGAPEGRDPGPWFSSTGYLAHNADLRDGQVNPLVHYILYGKAEGRSGGERSADEPKPVESVPARRARNVSGTLLFVSGEAGTPGNEYRVIRYVEAARANGLSAEWISVGQLGTDASRALLHEADVLIIWRAPWDERIEAAVGTMRAQDKKVVFDVDDLMVDPSLAEVKIIDGIRSQYLETSGVKSHFELVRRTMLAADFCFTTTEELAFHMRWAGKTTFVLPNGFDQPTHDFSRRSMLQWLAEKNDSLIRIGYAGGSRTHQKDFGLAVEAIARLLTNHADCRLVLFRTADGTPLIDVEEYPALGAVSAQIEWRPMQTLASLPKELARFDINLAPLEFGNVFCEAKSELKFFEAALVDVPTIASPTGPFRRAIDHGRTGYLAASADDWLFHLERLVCDPVLRRQVGRAAYRSALAQYGPLQRAVRYGCVLDQLTQHQPRLAARAFAMSTQFAAVRHGMPVVRDAETVFESGAPGLSELTVIVPLYNYENYIEEALDSVLDQSSDALDLVVVDDCSTDGSLAVAERWITAHQARFKRTVLLRNRSNQGLAFTRNIAFDCAETRYVLPLDADNRLQPECCETLLRSAKTENAAYAYPTIQHFGSSSALIGNSPYQPHRFVAGNYVDAMALVAKEAWAAVGGYDNIRYGWEDYDLWCKLAERGFAGVWVDEVLADYRVHPNSMLKVETTKAENYARLHRDFKTRHPWVSLVDEHTLKKPPYANPKLGEPGRSGRIDRFLPLMACPVTGQKLAFDEGRTALVCLDGLLAWPASGDFADFCDRFEAVARVASSDTEPAPYEIEPIVSAHREGYVLVLVPGDLPEDSGFKLDRVVYATASQTSKHADLAVSGSRLPFSDRSFAAVVVLDPWWADPRRSPELQRLVAADGSLHLPGNDERTENLPTVEDSVRV